MRSRGAVDGREREGDVVVARVEGDGSHRLMRILVHRHKGVVRFLPILHHNVLVDCDLRRHELLVRPVVVGLCRRARPMVGRLPRAAIVRTHRVRLAPAEGARARKVAVLDLLLLRHSLQPCFELHTTM